MLKFPKLKQFLPSFPITDQSFRCFSNNNNINHQKPFIPPPQPIQPKTIYHYHKPIHFNNGRFLLYMNKQNLSTPFILDLPYTVVLAYIAYLISKNPFYLVMPSALPIMIFTQLICSIPAIQYFLVGFNRIYLLNNGIHIQIIYSNKIRRYIKNNPDQTIHIIGDFANIYEEDIKNQKIQPYKGTRFPIDQNISFENTTKPFILQYGWTIRDKDFNNYILPAKFQFVNWELLTKVMNGIMISMEHATKEGTLNEQVYPTIEQQMENIKKLTQKEKQHTNEKQRTNNKQSTNEKTNVKEKKQKQSKNSEKPQKN